MDTNPSETIKGGRYVNTAGFWVNCDGHYIDYDGNEVSEPVKAVEPKKPVADKPTK